MAKMFPTDPQSFTTTGERQVFKFLRTALGESFLAWYSPDIADREPDFVVLSPDSGIIVLEVKDWTIDQILELNPKEALLAIGDGQEWRKNPLAQAREYVHTLMGLFAKKARHRQNRQIPFPITWGAVLPHIKKADFIERGLDKALEPGRILFWDDVRPDSPLMRDPSGTKGVALLREKFPPLFKFALVGEDVNWARSILFPIARIDVPRAPKAWEQRDVLAVMDQEQENLARTLGVARLLIGGPAGSGKTLVLASYAAWLLAMSGNVRRILITCFNLSLMGYIRRLLAKKGVPLGSAGVEVIPFYTLCEKILDEKLPHSGEGADYYQLVVSEAGERVASGHPLRSRWDAILVDEGQDFSPAMAQLLLNLLPDNGALMVVKDDSQRLYQAADNSWDNLEGIVKKSLSRQYRNSRDIATLAWRLAGLKEPEFYGGPGPKPGRLNGESMAALVERIADKAAELVKAGVPMNEIAVLYTRSDMGDGRIFPEAMIAALEARGVLARWAARDTLSKREFDITTDSVTISTIHSAKGLDFAHVFIIGLDHLDLTRPQDKALAHVGMTRARENLVICLSRPSPLDSLL